jgi:hypothetical protein
VAWVSFGRSDSDEMVPFGKIRRDNQRENRDKTYQALNIKKQ